MAEATLRPAGTLHLLVAEDEPHIRRILSTLLEDAGFLITTVTDGEEALTRLRGDAPCDLVIMDLLMPVRSGLDVLEVVRALPHRERMPVVILTAKGQDVDRERAFQLGASDFMTKPFSPKKLLNRVDQLLAER